MLDVGLINILPNIQGIPFELGITCLKAIIKKKI